MDLLYRAKTEDGDDTIDRGIIIVGAEGHSSFPAEVLPIPPLPSTSNYNITNSTSPHLPASNNNIKYNISDFTVIIDNEITDGQTPVRTLNVPAVSTTLGEAIDRAGRLYGVKTSLIISE